MVSNGNNLWFRNKIASSFGNLNTKRDSFGSLHYLPRPAAEWSLSERSWGGSSRSLDVFEGFSIHGAAPGHFL